MIDADLKSTVYIKNVVETSAVTVTPILYLSNGARYSLPESKLEPAGIAVIDVKSALQNIGIAPYATLSGYMEIDYNWPWEPICATIRNLDTAHSLVFYYGFHPSKPIQLPNQPAPVSGPKRNVVEGVWWKQEPNVTGFVTLTNTGAKSIDAHMEVSDDQGVKLAGHVINISPHGTKLVDLNELDSAPTSQGGIRVTYVADADQGPVLISGGLQDRSAGYSAIMPFAPAPQATAPSNTTIAELGLMTGPTDPMLHFPAGLVFAPYSVLRNISDAPLTATPTLWWMSGGVAQSAELSAFTLSPYQAMNLDVPAILTKAGLKGFSGSVNLVFDVQGNTADVLAAGGAVDQSNSYVFAIAPRGVTQSAGKSLSHWSIANGDDTMVTLWNPADEAQDLIFRLDYPGGHYSFPIHLGPKATQMFNISEIVNSQTPDAEGNVVSMNVQEGSAKLMGMRDEIEHIFVTMDGSIYNVQKATCYPYGCETCDGVFGTVSLIDNPWYSEVNHTKQLTATETYNTGTHYSVTNQRSWTSSNTSIATVGSGLVNGVNPGSATVYAQDTYPEPVYTGNRCGDLPPCPFAFNTPGGQAPGNVAQLSCTSPVVRGQSTTCTISGPSGESISGWTFTDGNGNQVSSSSTSSTWSGMMVTSGTVTVTAGSASLSYVIAVISRPSFAFTAANPSQLLGTNSITCYSGQSTTLTSPPNNNQDEGAACADQAFSFQTSSPISDGGPNNGYQYILSASNSYNGQATRYQYIVVSDLLSATTFYNAQCGTYSSSNSNGFIAGLQLKQNVFDHEMGPVLSHWTEYVNAQNSSNNNIGSVVEAQIGAPGMPQQTFITNVNNVGGAARNAILAAVANEPCYGLATYDSSQACKYCGIINVGPSYYLCGGAQPVAYCQ